jgi:methyl-accepting chemotaxis protein
MNTRKETSDAMASVVVDNYEKLQKIHDAMAKIVEAIQHLSDAVPRTGSDQQKLNDTLRVLNEARELLAKWRES